MKIYITLEDGRKHYYANKLEAKRKAKKALKFYEENAGDSGLACDEVETEYIPTTKKELIKWLNNNAYYTGWTTGD